MGCPVSDTDTRAKVELSADEWSAMSIDDLDVDRGTAKRQFIFWNAVALTLGFVVFVIL